MWFKQLVQFLHLSILHFRTEMLVLAGDELTLPELQYIRQSLNVTLPSIVILISPKSPRNTLEMSQVYTSRQLTVVFLNPNNDLIWLRKVLTTKYRNSNPLVLVSPWVPEYDRIKLATIFSDFNVVTIEVDYVSPIKVFAWGKALRQSRHFQMIPFEGPEPIFHSKHIDALVFRRQMHRFPGAPVKATMMTTTMAPYTFLLNDYANGPLLVASSSLKLFQIIGDILNFSLKILFNRYLECASCFTAIPNYGKPRGMRQLFDYREISTDLIDTKDNELMIGLLDTATVDNKLYEFRRYVAIVPYRTMVLDRSLEIINSLVNAAVLLVWLIGAAFFTAIRTAMRLAVPDRRQMEPPSLSMTSLYFRYLARVLGNSMGCERCKKKSESFLTFVIGVFATITSMMFTGALFEQMVAIEPPRQIDTMAELAASNMAIVLCYGDTNVKTCSDSHSYVNGTLSILSIELALVRHDTSQAFVLPETIADIIHDPALQYANGTPVYHIVKEPFCISAQYFVLVPSMIQRLFNSLWDRLVESGVNLHVGQQTIALYKTKRTEWLRRIRKKVDIERPSHDKGVNSQIVLLGLVLVIGYLVALFAFAVELVCAMYCSGR